MADPILGSTSLYQTISIHTPCSLNVCPVFIQWSCFDSSLEERASKIRGNQREKQSSSTVKLTTFISETMSLELDTRPTENTEGVRCHCPLNVTFQNLTY